MKKIFFFLLFFLVIGLDVFATSISNYCSTPPFITSTVIPNVLFIVDNSGSMKYAAYWPLNLHHTDIDNSFDNSTRYYGIFDSNSRYSYSKDGDYFYKDPSGAWSGNFLNWLTMRRYDILLKVLIGGNYKEINGNKFLQGFNIVESKKNYTSYQFKKEIDTEGFCPSKYVGKKFTVGSQHSPSGSSDDEKRNFRFWFKVKRNKKKYDYYAIRVKIDKKPEGILQNISARVRVGLMVFNHGDGFEKNDTYKNNGGRVISYISDNNTQLANRFLNQDVWNGSYPPLYPHNWTPLAETYYEAVRYFEAIKSAYNKNVDYSKKDPIEYRCQKNFVILLTDGESTKDEDLPGGYWGSKLCTSDSKFNIKTWMEKIARNEGYSDINKDYKYKNGSDGTKYLEGVAYYAHVSDLRSDLKGMQNLTLYDVYVFGHSNTAVDILSKSAKYGGFVDLNGNGKPDLRSEWDKNGDSIPDNFFHAYDGYKIENYIKNIINDILRQASSGTAASILATNEKSGSIILQALFYPQRSFDNSTKLDWSGSLKALWFYLGPFVQNIREDTDENKILNLFSDHIVEFYFDNASNKTKVHVFKDTNGDGKPDESLPDESLSELKYLWDAGYVLWATNADNRKIFTDVDNLTYDNQRGNFIVANASKLQKYLNADNITQAEDIINYIRGEDLGYRNRTVTINGVSHVWKLGDIIHSTPAIVSWIPLNSYDKKAPYGYNDITYKEFINSSVYQNRGMVFVGANDGMLHAFRLGKIKMLNYGSGNIAKLDNITVDNKTFTFGSEAWAFIPENVLPYLKYYMQNNYCHMYYVDLTPYVLDAPVYDNKTNSYANTADKIKNKNSWRTILIGGLRFGGACGDNVSASITPPEYSGKPDGLGRSSYFAIDVTDPENPRVLWEFADNDLGFTTTGPSVVHIPYYRTDENGNKVIDNTRNGYWYVVFASGPDNYNGEVHKPLYLYVLNLATGKLVKKWQLSGSSSSCPYFPFMTCDTDVIGDHNAFAGRMFEASVDTNLDYADDALYFGYSYKNSNNEWEGGVIRVVTNDDPDVGNWKISKVIDGIGPVTSAVRNLVDKRTHKLWLFFGEGRYFTKNDDPTATRAIYGVEDPCYNSTKATQFDDNCPAPLTKNDLTDVTSNPNAADVTGGWYINLDSANNGYNSERLITDPTVTTRGWVLYTTFEPTNDICGFGGRSYLWMVNYNNGGTPHDIEGNVYLQLSTGAIKKVNLKSEFGTNHGSKGGRRLANPSIGAPPPQSDISIIIPPPPINTVIHWEEK